MDKDEKFIDKCFKEMFSRVGEKFPSTWAEKDKEWFRHREWTAKEQESFKKWLIKEFKKAYPHLRRRAEMEAGMFILCYGWNTKELVNEK